MFVLDDLILAEAAVGGAEALGAAELAGAGEAAAGAAGAGEAAAGLSGAEAAMGAGMQAGLQSIPGYQNIAAQMASSPAAGGIGAAVGTEPVATQIATRGIQANLSPTSYSAFGEPVPIGSPAATMADPTGLASEQIGLDRATAPEPSFFDKATAWAKKNPGWALTGGILAANALGGRGGRGPTGYTPGILDKYRLSPNFQGSHADPRGFQYTPSYQRMAEGGVTEYNKPNPMRNPYETGGATTYPQAAIPQPDYTLGLQEPRARAVAPQTFFTDVEGMAEGGSTSALLSTYERMMRRAPSHAPAPEGSVGIYSDNDPDTRNLDAYRAAQIRMAKTNKRANVTSPAQPKIMGLGSLSLGPAGAKKDEGPQFQEAAQGGIMGASHLGGYAAGGNPRLLKGPGDGMSDDIPATINGRQPARLADGEFVIPADVVSHLGNGSTDAGAKKLHHMMDKVRKARTGNPKQGKQINPDKFIPR